ncbi:hypothetical protein L3X38_028334 [Prunus dulcis]|uniref:Uncharacterized protein n=1 Tax=Prunus dulcis TaxID=3755 RepID=A0AAD4VSA5_PRUDU|nr:hypothetical protein L3X38_028334 [Prunus dulcis]
MAADFILFGLQMVTKRLVLPIFYVQDLCELALIYPLASSYQLLLTGVNNMICCSVYIRIVIQRIGGSYLKMHTLVTGQEKYSLVWHMELLLCHGKERFTAK